MSLYTCTRCTISSMVCVSYILCRDSGEVNSLAIITTPGEKQNVLFVSEYTPFLNSSILVTGGFLVSTQPCIVEGMRIEVNTSIREANAGIQSSLRE